ncbi:MAG: type II toxin-antitoxin system HicA family toxin [Steroidobacteraceae bacterium]|jgi:predicted RNA binding protein YcfA (HicA-like mRNA interferase family)
MGAKLTPVDASRLIRFFEHYGFSQRRQKGSHVSMVKAGVARPLIIPTPGEVTVGVIMSNLRTAGLTRDELLGWLTTH